MSDLEMEEIRDALAQTREDLDVSEDSSVVPGVGVIDPEVLKFISPEIPPLRPPASQLSRDSTLSKEGVVRRRENFGANFSYPFWVDNHIRTEFREADTSFATVWLMFGNVEKDYISGCFRPLQFRSSNGITRIPSSDMERMIKVHENDNSRLLALIVARKDPFNLSPEETQTLHNFAKRNGQFSLILYPVRSHPVRLGVATCWTSNGARVFSQTFF